MFEKKINRRDFLRLSAVASSSLLLASCGGWFSAGTQSETPEDYYSVNGEKIKVEIDDMLDYVQKICDEKYGSDLASAMIADSRSQFDNLLPDLPYIGGSRNGLTMNLCLGAAALAFYWTMKNNHHTLDETGEVLYLATDRMIRSNPLVSVDGRLSTSDGAQSKLRQEAIISQEREFPENWVYEFVEGDGVNFDYGVDYTECGLCKYYHRQNADELTPYLCLLDFPPSIAMNTGLMRTSTLAHGAKCCDFRYKAGQPCQMEWTPDFLKK